jgi:TRAP-type C4-dicarboxylate transport system permease small subunit
MLCVAVSSAALFVIAVLITVDVFFRYALLSPIPAAVEICGLIEPYVILLPFAFTLSINQHVRVRVLTCRFPAGAQFVFEIFALLLVLGVSFLLAVCGATEFYASYAINEFIMAPVILPAWAGKLSQPLGWGILALQCIASVLSAHERYKQEAAWTP